MIGYLLLAAFLIIPTAVALWKGRHDKASADRS